MQQLNLGGDKSKQPAQTSAIRKITFDDPPADSALAAASKPAAASKQGDDFVMLDFKTPFSIGSRPLSVASDLQSSVSAATTDLVSLTIMKKTVLSSDIQWNRSFCKIEK